MDGTTGSCKHTQLQLRSVSEVLTQQSQRWSCDVKFKAVDVNSTVEKNCQMKRAELTRPSLWSNTMNEEKEEVKERLTQRALASGQV